MKTILEYFLDTLDIRYTKRFTRNLFQEHPHNNNMYGLKRMLDVYGVKILGVYVNTKNLQELNYPCILHIHGDFVIGMDCRDNTVRFLQHGKETTMSFDVFQQTWTGNALVVQETTDAIEPDFKEHRRDELISLAKTYSIPIMLIIAVVIGLARNFGNLCITDAIHLFLCSLGIIICSMLMEKQLYGESHYGDRICSLLDHANCGSVLDGPKTKVFGISWSEIGLGYFIANILLLSVVPSFFGAVTALNWIAMLYGIWSIYYQWRVAKNWCLLCIVVQSIIWTMGIIAAVYYFTVPIAVSFISCQLSYIVFAIIIVVVHQHAAACATENKCMYVVQRYRALKANGNVAKALIDNSEYYETTLDDSSVIFGNPNAKMRVTILSNPHCAPCAKMHKRVEEILNMEEKNICVQYIFSSFNEQLKDSCRYLISCFLNNPETEVRRKFSLWYTKDKFNYERIIKQNETNIHTPEIEEEMKKHAVWCEKTSLSATPTVLVNGHILPKEYELEDLPMITNIDIMENNILKDINGRSTTPLGAAPRTAEETV